LKVCDTRHDWAYRFGVICPARVVGAAIPPTKAKAVRARMLCWSVTMPVDPGGQTTGRAGRYHLIIVATLLAGTEPDGPPSQGRALNVPARTIMF
jgi:hypothetical protein